MSVGRDELASFLRDYLRIDRIPDIAPNGVQVPGRDAIQRLAVGVSCSLDFFELAVEERADAVLVHHGLFWERAPRQIDPVMKGRLKYLFDHDLSLFAYHLPLDCHADVGNNVELARRLGLTVAATDFGRFQNVFIGAIGEYASPVTLTDLVERVARVGGDFPLVIDGGRSHVSTVGILTGGGTSSVDEAIARGLDVFLTGEVREPIQSISREAGIAFLAMGHYNSEKLGVQALGNLIEERFAVEVFFIDVPNSA